MLLNFSGRLDWSLFLTLNLPEACEALRLDTGDEDLYHVPTGAVSITNLPISHQALMDSIV